MQLTLSGLPRFATCAPKQVPFGGYGPHDNAFSGEVNWVQIDLGKDDQDHLISPEERFKIAMALQ